MHAFLQVVPTFLSGRSNLMMIRIESAIGHHEPHSDGSFLIFTKALMLR